MPNGLGFERQVHALLKKMGFEAEVTKASGDGGIDIIAHSKEHITGGKYIIQCKDWSKPVGEPPVRDLYGVVTAERANKGILITTSIFTSPAIRFVAGKPLELIDGTKFNGLLTKHGLSVMNNSSQTDFRASEDERIKDLINRLNKMLNKNPKNITVMKELGDIYLQKGLYDNAIVFYERLVPEMVETHAYWGGLNNYGVTLAMKKRYDEALTVFQKLQRNCFSEESIDGLTNEAHLVLYLGLYDIAIRLYEDMRSREESPDIKDFYNGLIESASEELKKVEAKREEIINKEKADMEDQSKFSYFCLSLDAAVRKAKPESIIIPFETAKQKASEEVDQHLIYYKPFFDADYEINNEFHEIWMELHNQISTSNHLDKAYCAYVSNKVLQLYNKCNSAYSDYKHIIDKVPNHPLQEFWRQDAINNLEALTKISNTTSKFIECLSNIIKQDTSSNTKNAIDKCFVDSFSDCDEEHILASASDKFIEVMTGEYKKAEAKWEEIINKEKAEWREKLHNTLYANWSPKMKAKWEEILNKEKTQPNKQCFIATAVYGSPFSPEVQALRQWRDRSLSSTAIGRSFISAYYKYSPRIADYIKHRPVIKGTIKKVLNVVVWMNK